MRWLTRCRLRPQRSIRFRRRGIDRRYILLHYATSRPTEMVGK